MLKIPKEILLNIYKHHHSIHIKYNKLNIKNQMKKYLYKSTLFYIVNFFCLHLSIPLTNSLACLVSSFLSTFKLLVKG